MATEYWAYQFFLDPKLKEQVEDESLTGDELARLMEDPDAWEEVFSFGTQQSKHE